MDFIIYGFISVWLVLIFIIGLIFSFFIALKILKSKKISENRLDKYCKNFIQGVSIYIILVGISIIIIIPIIYILYICKVGKENWLIFFSEKNIQISLAINLLVYYLFISWYISCISNKKEIKDFFSQLNYVLINKVPEKLGITFSFMCKIGAIFFVIPYISTKYILISIISLVGTSNIFVLSLGFFIYLLFFYIIEKILLLILKVFNKFHKNFWVKTIRVAVFASLLYIYVYGNTPKFSSSHITMALTITLTLYGFIEIFQNYLKELWQVFKTKLGLKSVKIEKLNDKSELELKLKSLENELVELKKELKTFDK